MHGVKNKHVIAAIFLAKIILSGFFASEYVDKLFIPFVNDFTKLGFRAWSDSGVQFPYPPIMVFILLVPVKLGGVFGSVFIQNLLFHLPIVLADFAVLNFLKKLLPTQSREIVFYYLLSPILIYASYMHSQLDLIPTAIIFISVFYLLKVKLGKAFLLFGLAASVKWHTLVALPFYIIFMLKRDLINRKTLIYPLIAFVPLLVSLLPFGSLQDALVLFQANEKNLIFESYLGIMNLKIFLFPFFYLIVLGRSFGYTRINNELFIGLMAIIFMTFVIMVYPNPGWFLWSLPFLSYSFIKNNKKKSMVLLLHSLISLGYLVFFLFFYSHPYNDYANLTFLGKPLDMSIENSGLQSIAFTTLVGFMVLGIYAVYKAAIQNSLLYKRRFQSFMIGIAGDSGAGKSTLLTSVQKVLGSHMMTSLEGDGEHKWERGDTNWSQVTHLNPKGNELHKQLLHLIRLKQGRATYRSDYNHDTGRFDLAKKIRSKDFITIAGLHPFYLKGARDNIDLKIYVDTNEELRKHWKVSRDIKKRGYSVEKSLEQLKSREEDSRKYIQPQIKYADLVIRYKTAKEIEIGKTQVTSDDLLVEYEIDIDVPVEKMLTRLQNLNVAVISHDFDEDLIRQTITLKLPPNFEGCGFKTDFDDFFQTVGLTGVNWETGINGMNQVAILHSIKNKYIGFENEEQL